MEKICRGCNKPKPIVEFTGVHNDNKCKECLSKKAIRWSKNNPEAAKVAQQRYRDSGKGTEAVRRFRKRKKEG